ncbi:XkdX family protein [Terrihalobacillus insolitus]|nr:XkdX family protein [Terrihalobacillus insolitus]MDC3412514.1 XkdX family protein [Terrihalobacillus insolitus]
MSPLFNYFKSAYSDGNSKVTTKSTLKNAVTKGYITESEYQQITGEEYVA